MGEFGLYFQLGIEHIMDVKAYDHMLFVISLCALYLIKDWKSVLILATAFTIGHSITLILSVLDRIKVDQDLIETLIPITILIAALYNFIPQSKERKKWKFNFHYLLAGFFGLIHGMGFANYLRSLLIKGDEVFVPLLAFNVGIEVGQIGIVIIYFLMTTLVIRSLKLRHLTWQYLISGIIVVFAIRMIFF